VTDFNPLVISGGALRELLSTDRLKIGAAIVAGLLTIGAGTAGLKENVAGTIDVVAADGTTLAPLRAKAATISSGTLTVSAPALDISQTWNGQGSFNALKVNVTSTSSAVGSTLFDMQVGGVSRFSLDRQAYLKLVGDASIGIQTAVTDDNTAQLYVPANSGLLHINTHWGIRLANAAAIQFVNAAGTSYSAVFQYDSGNTINFINSLGGIQFYTGNNAGTQYSIRILTTNGAAYAAYFDSATGKIGFGTNTITGGQWTFYDPTATTGDSVIAIRDGASRAARVRFGNNAGTYDLSFFRESAGVLAIGDGSTTLTNYGDLKAKNVTFAGTSQLTGNVGIGAVSSATATLTVNKAYANPTTGTSQLALSGQYTLATGNGVSANAWGMVLSTIYSVSGDGTGALSQGATALWQPNVMLAMSTAATVGIANLRAARLNLVFNGNQTGRVTTFTLLDMTVPQAAGTNNGQVGTAQGIILADQGTISGFVVSNAIGVAIADQNSSGNMSNLILGATTISAGTWSIYNASARDNYFGGKLKLAAGTTARSQINFAASVAPTTPNDGDWWFDGSAMKVQIGGVTKTVQVA
jgi:hypothetical protein